MIKISIQKNYCLVEPQGPLTAEDFAEIARQVDPVIEREGELDGLKPGNSQDGNHSVMQSSIFGLLKAIISTSRK